VRQGFIYIRLQIYFVLAALIIGSALFFVLRITHQDWQFERRVRDAVLLNQALDVLAEDIKYAERVQVAADSIIVTRQNIDYAYFLNAQRLVRRKDSYLYLTPAELALSALGFREENGTLHLTLTAGAQNWERRIRR
jgi:hypothetical protein